MSTEAHKLIGISLSKIAQSRASRGGVSLHKNLLVATVLHKARYIFMEEAYQIVHGNNKPLTTSSSLQDSPFNYKLSNESEGADNINTTSDSASECEPTLEDTISELIPTKDEKLLMSVDEWRHSEDSVSLEGGTERLTDTTGDVDLVDVEHQPQQQQPPSYSAHIELTYLNLDKEKETVENNNHLKRRRPSNDEWGEVEEAVLSILPKRPKSTTPVDVEPTVATTDADLTFLDETDFLSEPPSANVNSSVCDIEKVTSTPASPAMEIDRLSSLVSIFSFANLEMSAICGDEESSSAGKGHSMGANDQCSTQAKDNSDVLQPMPSFLAMTV